MDKLHVTTNTPLLFQLGQLRRGLYSLRGWQQFCGLEVTNIYIVTLTTVENIVKIFQEFSVRLVSREMPCEGYLWARNNEWNIIQDNIPV